jgi:BCCT family betaine/carnitine transporter
LTGIPADFALELMVVSICVLVFASSVWLGLQEGIRRLSNFNIVLALIFLLAVLLASDTFFLLEMAVNSLGFLFQNSFAMTFWTDPIDSTGFVGDWTVFYWAWWIAYGPFVGLFVTRISRGRTIREVVVGMLLLGSLGVWLFFLVLGNHSLGLQLSGQLDVVEIMQSSGGNAAVVAGLNTLPMAGLIIGMFAVVAVIFVSTTYDSASYTLAATATQSLDVSEDPPRWHRVFWAVAIAILPIGLMYAGGIKEAQTATLVVSLPLTFTFWLSGWGLLKSLARRSSFKLKRHAVVCDNKRQMGTVLLTATIACFGYRVR